jgi:hypothetical protein
MVTTTMCEEKRELKERLESIMTYKNKSVLMVALSLVLALALAGCSVALGAAKVNTHAPDEDVSQSPSATSTPIVTTIPDEEATQSPAATDAPDVSASPSAASPDGKNENTETQDASGDPVLEAYKAVLRNEAGFFSADNKKDVYLNDFLTNNEIYGTAFEVTRYTVLDMDGDNVPEVVLELSVGGEPQFFEALHYMNGAVNGYLIPYRGLEALKADGTFSFSNGAADNGWGRLKFGTDAFETDMLGRSESSQGDTLNISYFINNKPVTKESFDSSMNEQSAKSDAVWNEFSQAGIETELSANK